MTVSTLFTSLPGGFYICRISRYRLMSGIESITIAITAAITTAFTSLPIISSLPFSLCSVFAQDVLDRTNRVRQGRLNRFRQPHSGPGVGGLARDHEAPPWAAAERGEQG